MTRRYRIAMKDEAECEEDRKDISGKTWAKAQKERSRQAMIGIYDRVIADVGEGTGEPPDSELVQAESASNLMP